MCDSIDNYINNIMILSTLEENWDSYGGKEPSNDVLRNVKDFLINMSSAYNDNNVFSKMFIYPTNCGGVQLEFDYGEDKYFEIEFLPSGDVDIYYELNGRCIEKNKVGIDYGRKMLDGFLNKVLG